MANSSASDSTATAPSLRRSLLLNLTATALIPLLLLAGLVLYYLSNRALDDVSSKNQLLASAISGQVEVFLRAPEASLISLKDLQLTQRKRLQPGTFQELLDSLAESSTLIESIYILDQTGDVSDVGLPHKNDSLRQEFLHLSLGHLGFIKQARQHQNPVWSDTFLSIITGKPSLALAVPAGEQTLVGNISIDLLNQFLKKLHSHELIEVSIVDRHGEIIACSRPLPSMCPSNLWDLPLVRDAAQHPAATSIYEFEGETFLGSIAQIEGPGWLTLVAQSREDAYQPVYRTSILFLTTILITLFLILIVALLISKKISAPIRLFARQTRTLAEGDYGLQKLDPGYSEIALLAEDLQHMAERISERESALKQSELAYRTLTENLPGIAYRLHVHDNYRLQFMNGEHLKMTGFETEHFATNSACPLEINIHPDDLSDFIATIKGAIIGQTPFAQEYRFRHADGDYRTFFEKGSPIYDATGAINHIDGVIFDVTDRKRAEEIILQSEKMLTVGGLAAGMAHEINNPLAGILQNCQLIHQRLDGTRIKNQEIARQAGLDLNQLTTYLDIRRVPHMLEAIKDSGHRAAKIVENILDFSRKSRADFIPQEMKSLIERSLELARSDYDLHKDFDFRNIEITREYDENLPQVKCDPAQIQQVLLNIFKNGAQAMNKHDGENPASFRIRTAYQQDMVCIDIIDNGPGMTAAVRKRIFEPFYTTKDVGKGTGLGLSICYFIITEKHHGSMNVFSTPGEGTRFTICLPPASSANR